MLYAFCTFFWAVCVRLQLVRRRPPSFLPARRQRRRRARLTCGQKLTGTPPHALDRSLRAHGLLDVRTNSSGAAARGRAAHAHAYAWPLQLHASYRKKLNVPLSGASGGAGRNTRLLLRDLREDGARPRNCARIAQRRYAGAARRAPARGLLDVRPRREAQSPAAHAASASSGCRRGAQNTGP